MKANNIVVLATTFVLLLGAWATNRHLGYLVSAEIQLLEKQLGRIQGIQVHQMEYSPGWFRGVLQYDIRLEPNTVLSETRIHSLRDLSGITLPYDLDPVYLTGHMDIRHGAWPGREVGFVTAHATGEIRTPLYVGSGSQPHLQREGAVLLTAYMDWDRRISMQWQGKHALDARDNPVNGTSTQNPWSGEVLFHSDLSLIDLKIGAPYVHLPETSWSGQSAYVASPYLQLRLLKEHDTPILAIISWEELRFSDQNQLLSTGRSIFHAEGHGSGMYGINSLMVDIHLASLLHEVHGTEHSDSLLQSFSQWNSHSSSGPFELTATFDSSTVPPSLQIQASGHYSEWQIHSDGLFDNGILRHPLPVGTERLFIDIFQIPLQAGLPPKEEEPAAHEPVWPHFWFTNPVFGTVFLGDLTETNPLEVTLLAGGSFQVNIDAPENDCTVFIHPWSPDLQLLPGENNGIETFLLESTPNTALIVVDSLGQKHCSGTHPAMNSMLLIDVVSTDSMALWVGTNEPAPSTAQIEIRKYHRE